MENLFADTIERRSFEDYERYAYLSNLPEEQKEREMERQDNFVIPDWSMDLFVGGKNEK